MKILSLGIMLLMLSTMNSIASRPGNSITSRPGLAGQCDYKRFGERIMREGHARHLGGLTPYKVAGKIELEGLRSVPADQLILIKRYTNDIACMKKIDELVEERRVQALARQQ